MSTIRKQSADIESYINGQPPEVQDILNALRDTIRNAAPGAEETINYAIPTFRVNGNLVHFAAFREHIGFYPGPSGIEAFKQELSEYRGAKGSVRFPLGSPLPLDLISRIVKFRLAENLAKKKNR